MLNNVRYTHYVVNSDANDFQITKRLGAGSYGEAYLGHNITSMEQYVFKLYRFGKLKRKKMLREILVTQSVCGHPNIIKLLHVIRQSLTDYPVLVLEHANGTSYRDLFPILKPKDVKYYMYEILKGLAYAHERGVMHKDIQPANIMIDHQERVVKIIDWGLSQFYFNSKLSLYIYTILCCTILKYITITYIYSIILPIYCNHRGISIRSWQYVL